MRNNLNEYEGIIFFLEGTTHYYTFSLILTHVYFNFLQSKASLSGVS